MKHKNHISGTTSLVGIIGWPVEHSLSPKMHNAAFVDLGLDWAYVPLPVRPDDVKLGLKGLSALNFVGANVTVPHKQAVMRYMDELSKAARTIGAVNTIHLEEGKFIGYNTDSTGFLNSLIEADYHPKGMRVVVLGAGGAARAVTFALLWAEADSVIILNRTVERAAFLVDDLIDAFPDSTLRSAPLSAETLSEVGGTIDLVVNTTSVGMSPHVEESPWPEEVPIPQQAIFCDLVYNPLDTKFLTQARAAGVKTINGLGMLIHQGAAAFEQWTGEQAPIEVMRQACQDALSSQRGYELSFSWSAQLF